MPDRATIGRPLVAALGVVGGVAADGDARERIAIGIGVIDGAPKQRAHQRAGRVGYVFVDGRQGRAARRHRRIIDRSDVDRERCRHAGRRPVGVRHYNLKDAIRRRRVVRGIVVAERVEQRLGLRHRQRAPAYLSECQRAYPTAHGRRYGIVHTAKNNIGNASAVGKIQGDRAARGRTTDAQFVTAIVDLRALNRQR